MAEEAAAYGDGDGPTPAPDAAPADETSAEPEIAAQAEPEPEPAPEMPEAMADDAAPDADRMPDLPDLQDAPDGAIAARGDDALWPHDPDDAAEDAPFAEPMTPPPLTAEPQRRGMDDALMAILREEAAREEAARQAEGRGVETQPDLGIEEAAITGGLSEAARRRISEMQGLDPEPPTSKAARRELLPDIEEINASLQPGDNAIPPEAYYSDIPPPKGRSGFRSGFTLMMFLAVALMLGYVLAPRLAAQMPGAAPMLQAYVATVDRGRVVLDGWMRDAIGRMTDSNTANGG